MSICDLPNELLKIIFDQVLLSDDFNSIIPMILTCRRIHYYIMDEYSDIFLILPSLGHPFEFKQLVRKYDPRLMKNPIIRKLYYRMFDINTEIKNNSGVTHIIEEFILKTNLSLYKRLSYVNDVILKKQYFNEKKQYHHYDDKPSLILYINYDEENKPYYFAYYKNDKLHRSGDKPAVIEYDKFKNYILKYIFYKYNKQHRDEGPSLIKYYENGQVHMEKFMRKGRSYKRNIYYNPNGTLKQ